MEEDLLYRAYKALEYVYDCDGVDKDRILEDEHLNLMTIIQIHLSAKYNVDWKDL